jgi:hypothetical protein
MPNIHRLAVSVVILIATFVTIGTNAFAKSLQADTKDSCIVCVEQHFRCCFPVSRNVCCVDSSPVVLST